MIVKYLVLAFYFLILFLIGFFASKRIRGLKDYYVGGKNLGYWVVAFSARATGESAWLLLGLTGMGALIGLNALWVVAGEVLGVSIAWFLMAKPFKKQTDKYEAITIPDFLVSHFKPKTHLLRIVAATSLSVFVTIYVSAQIDATGSAFETFFPEIDYFTGAFIGFAIVVSYIFFGGFIAVSWSDLFQGLMMLLALTALPVTAILMIGNPGELISVIRTIDPSLLNIWGEGGFSLLSLMTALGFMGIGLGFLGSPQVFVRFMSIRGEDEIRKGRIVAISFTLITDSAAILIGLLGRYYFTKIGDDPLAILGNGGQNVLPMLVEQLMPLFIIALYIAAVLAAIMSTVDSLLVVASSAITRDFYQQIFHPELKEENMGRISRAITLLIALVAFALAITVALLSPERTIFWFVVFGWSGIAATFCPLIILSLSWKNYNEYGALASMISGFLCVPIFKFFVPHIPVIGVYFTQLAELIPSFIISLLFGIFITKWTTRKKYQSH